MVTGSAKRTCCASADCRTGDCWVAGGVGGTVGPPCPVCDCAGPDSVAGCSSIGFGAGLGGAGGPPGRRRGGALGAAFLPEVAELMSVDIARCIHRHRGRRIRWCRNAVSWCLVERWVSDCTPGLSNTSVSNFLTRPARSAFPRASRGTKKQCFGWPVATINGTTLPLPAFFSAGDVGSLHITSRTRAKSSLISSASNRPPRRLSQLSRACSGPRTPAAPASAQSRCHDFQQTQLSLPNSSPFALLHSPDQPRPNNNPITTTTPPPRLAPC